MMKITQFEISDYKSISNATLPIQQYGKGKNKSSVTFLVGKNETGKSSILESIYLSQEGFKGKEFDEFFHKGNNEPDEIRITTHIDIGEPSFYRNIISKNVTIDKDLVSKIVISKLSKHTTLEPKQGYTFYGIEIENSIKFHEYVITGTTEKKIEKLKEVNKVDVEITPENAKGLIKEGQTLLSKAGLQDFLRGKLKSVFDDNLPKIQLWKPKPEFLINEAVDLEEFKQDTSISIPLKNIFNIHGIEDEQIKEVIEKALKRLERKAELEANLSKSITKYINEIWEEHNINLKIRIDGTLCSVHIEDKDKEHKYYDMKQRSDGFNQFISLILSISTPTDSKSLSDSIILLDEPEIHLHPSGIRYMRDEILKIGKSNSVIVSTHSHYMIDITTPERHFLVSKKEMASEVKQIDESTSMTDDEVLRSAFGINLFKELLPQNIIVVEGGDDKIILSHCLRLLYNDFFYSIKSAGGASKAYGIASLLADEKVPAFFVFDDDHEGESVKKEILKKLKDSHDKNHVLTIRDLVKELKEKATIEDLLPKDFVKAFFETEMEHEFDFTKDQPLMFLIKNQDDNLKKHSEQLDAKKMLLSEKFVETYDTKEKIENDVPNIIKLVNELVAKIRAI